MHSLRGIIKYIHLTINQLFTNRIFLLVRNNKLGIVYYTYQGMSGDTSFKNVFFCPKIIFYLYMYKIAFILFKENVLLKCLLYDHSVELSMLTLCIYNNN